MRNTRLKLDSNEFDSYSNLTHDTNDLKRDTQNRPEVGETFQRQQNRKNSSSLYYIFISIKEIIKTSKNLDQLVKKLVQTRCN